jgi:hypothetical protein
MRTLFRMAIFGALISGLGFASAEASPLLKAGDLNAPEAAPLSLVQNSTRRHPIWSYGPKRGWGLAKRPAVRGYRYRSPSVRAYRYSSP